MLKRERVSKLREREAKLRERESKLREREARLLLSFGEGFKEEPVVIKYLTALGEELKEGTMDAVKCINPHDENIFIYELKESYYGIKYLYPKDIGTVNPITQTIFYLDDTINPKEVFVNWIDGQVIIENNRHKIVINRYESLKKGVENYVRSGETN